MDYKKILYEQLARDFSASPNEFAYGRNLFVRKKYPDGRRIYSSDKCMLKMLSVDGTGVMASESEALLTWLRSNFDGYAAWLSEVENLIKINDRLKEYGHKLKDFHHYYIPDKAADSIIMPELCPVKWYEQGEFEQFRGDSRFAESLAFSDTAPDMIAVVGLDENGNIIATAGASADSPTMWQIGVKVQYQARGRGIGSYLTWLLKREVTRRGFMPYYGTAESHIESQKVAYRCGFIPAWWEAYSD